MLTAGHCCGEGDVKAVCGGHTLPTRLLATANESFVERQRAASREATRREWDENAHSAARSRSDAAREFLDAAAARRQQRQELQDAWRAQVALKYAMAEDSV